MKVLTPVIRVINLLLQKVITLANVIANAFGGQSLKGIKELTGLDASNTSDMSNNLFSSNEEAKKLKRTLAGFDELSDMSSNLADSAEEAKKLKRILTGFDELNVLNKKTDSSSTISTDSTAVDADIAALATETYDPPEIDTEQIEGQFSNISDIFHKWFDNLPKLEFNFDTKKALDDLKNFGTNILNVITGLGSFVIEIGIKIADDLDLGRILNDVLALISAVFSLASALTDVLAPVLINLYDTFLSPIVQVLGTITSFLLETLTSAIQTVADFITAHSETIIAALKALTTALGSAFIAFMLLKGITSIGTAFTAVTDIIKAFEMGLLGMQGAMTASSGAMSAFGAGTKIATTATTLLKTGLSALLSPVGLVVTAVALLAAGFVYLWETNEGFRKEVTNLWENVLKPIFTELGDSFKKLWEDTLKPFWEENLKPMIDKISEEASVLMTHLKALWELILKPTIEAIIKVIGATIVTAIDIISSAIKIIIGVIESVVTIIQGVIDFLGGVFTGDWERA